MTDVEIAVATRADVGEGPVFDTRTGRLCWVDLPAGRLWARSLEAQPLAGSKWTIETDTYGVPVALFGG